jgi:hypothetical protein
MRWRLGGGFCSGEMVSADGLFLTNHHCGYDAIQSISSVEHDYLTDGFWAMTRTRMKSRWFQVSFLQYIDRRHRHGAFQIAAGISEEARDSQDPSSDRRSSLERKPPRRTASLAISR